MWEKSGFLQQQPGLRPDHSIEAVTRTAHPSVIVVLQRGYLKLLELEPAVVPGWL